MQVYKAWSALARHTENNVCQDDGAARSVPTITTAPVVVRVHPRPRRRQPLLTSQPPTPTPPLRQARLTDRPCPLRLPSNATLAAADAPDLTQWLEAAVAIAVRRREMGSEGLATLLAARLDGRLARALTRVRDSGQLSGAIAKALRDTGVEARPDCPIERILRSALRRHELRRWLERLR